MLRARPSEDISFYGTVSHSQVELFEPTIGLLIGGTLLISEQAVNLTYEHGGLLDDHLTLHANFDFTRLENDGNEYQRTYTGHGRVQADLALWQGRNITSVAAEFTRFESETAASSPNATTLGVTLQDELRLLQDEQLILSAAARFDHVAYSDVGVGNLYYRNPTVRGSVIYRFTPEQDVRFTVANAYRTPLPYESTVGAYLAGPVPFQVVVPNPGLDSTVHQMME
ncbi:MAG: TonB-dependent receptor, partial [Polyangiaceae bacterium]|nr:TonB-dependent receptor [Polyangiaceae bacterium]